LKFTRFSVIFSTIKTEKEKTARKNQSKKKDHQNTMPPGKNLLRNTLRHSWNFSSRVFARASILPGDPNSWTKN